MDVIARTAFGIDIDTQRNPNSPFVTYAKKLFQISWSIESSIANISYVFIYDNVRR